MAMMSERIKATAKQKQGKRDQSNNKQTNTMKNIVGEVKYHPLDRYIVHRSSAGHSRRS